MTFTEMDTLFQFYVKNRSDADADTRKLFLNNAQSELAIPFFFDSLEVVDTSVTTTADTASYSLPASMAVPTDIYDLDNNYALEEKSWDWYAMQDIQDGTQGQPTSWLMHEGKIYLYPTPDSAYNLRIGGRAFPVDMDDEHDCSYPKDWHLLLVIQAAADFLIGAGDVVNGQNLQNQALAKISSRTEFRTIRRRGQSSQVSPKRIVPSYRSNADG